MRDRDRLSVAAAFATVLTSSSLFSVLTSGRWLLAVTGVVAVVAGLSVLGRRLGLPAAASPLLPALGVLLYLTGMFAGSAAVLGLLPGPGALRLIDLQLRTGFSDIKGLAPPVPAHGGILLITVGGVSLIALAVDVIAATLRRPPLAGLPLLALFAVPAGIAPQGAGVFPFALSVIGYLLLLAADNTERVARWGRPLRTSAQLEHLDRLTAASYGEEQPTGAMGRRIGLSAICLALIVPVLLPGLREPIFGGNGSAGTGSGSGSGIVTYNPIVRLKDQLTNPRTETLLTIRTDAAAPDSYLRMAGLDQFDGRTWSQSSLRAGKEFRVTKGGLPAASLLGPVTKSTISITKNLDARWLPLPYQPTSVGVSGDWRWEGKTGTVFSTHDNARGASYTVTSRALQTDPTALDKAQVSVQTSIALAAYETVPPNLPRIIRDTADGIVARAKAVTAYQKAVAIQRFFRSDGRFTYSLKVPQGNGDDAIVNFLHFRQGFCEQFAATMALFARIEGIPARVAVGFTYGERSGNTYVVTTKDAHAWPELNFPGAGWLPFEPTPVAGRGEAIAPSYTQGTVSGPPGATARVGPEGPATSGPPLADRHRVGETNNPGSLPAVLTASRGRHGHPWRWGAAGVLAIALLGTPAVLRLATRRRRWRAALNPAAHAHAAWADLRDDARDFGLLWPASATPRGAAVWLQSRSELSPAALGALAQLVNAEELARYRRSVAGGRSRDDTDLRAAVAAVRSALAARLPVQRRWLARLAPASAVERLSVASGRAAAVGDRYERVIASRLRRLVTRRPSAT